MVKYYNDGATRVAMRTGSTLNWLFADQPGSTSVTTDAMLHRTGMAGRPYWPITCLVEWTGTIDKTAFVTLVFQGRHL
jgi:hypothetical protein